MQPPPALRRIITYPKLEERLQKQREEQDFITRLPYTVPHENIPLPAREFFKDFGGIIHSLTGKPVLDLTDYQYALWDSAARNNMCVKSQKTGISTSELLHDFQAAITTSRGKDILIIAQTEGHAIEHLYTLKRHIIESPKYAKYLITKSTELFFKEEQTKVGTLFIKNPDNPRRPTRIIGLGFVESAIWSWKNVNRIHMSDPAAADVLDDSGVFAAAFSRLANTKGRMMIEGPPRGTVKQFYELYKTFGDNHDPTFQVFIVKAGQAVANGLIDPEFLQSEKKRMGHLYPQYYEAEFIAGTGNLFDYDSVLACENRGTIYGLEYLIPAQIDYSTVKSIGFDVGLGSSLYNVTALEWLPAAKLGSGNAGVAGILRVIYSRSWDRSVYGDMIKAITDLNNLIRPRKLYGGAVNPEVIRDVKIAIGEIKNYEHLVKRAARKERPIEQYMQVVPIPESTLGSDANYHARAWVESGLLAIHPIYNDLTSQLKMAIVKPNGQLDKNKMPETDALDGFKFACWYFKFDAATGARNQAFRFYERGDAQL